jgi:hypothetical protein
MAKAAPKARRARDPDPIDPEYDPALPDVAGPPLDSGGLENLLNQLGELQGEAKVHVYRVRQGVRPPFAFLFATTAGEFAVEDVQARYGGGDYFVKAWQRGISGSLVNERFAIEGEPIVRSIAPVPLAAPALPGSPQFLMMPGQGGDAIAALGAMFTQSMDRLAQVIAGQQRPERSMKETLELLTVAKALAAPAGPAGDPLAMLTQLMGIMRDSEGLRGGDGKADGFTILQTAVEKVLPAIIQRLPLAAAPTMLPAPGPEGEPIGSPGLSQGHARPFARPASKSLAELAAEASAGVIAPSIAPVIPINPQLTGGVPMSDPKIAAIIGAYSQMFIQAATIGAEPGAYAENIVDMVDATPDAEPAVRAFFSRADWFEELSRYAPGVIPHREWFAQLGREVLDTLDAPLEPEGGTAESQHFAEGSG